MVFSLAGVLYAALLALRQADLRHLLAFVVVSHSSIMIIGLFSLEHLALQGSILLAAHFGLANVYTYSGGSPVEMELVRQDDSVSICTVCFIREQLRSRHCASYGNLPHTQPEPVTSWKRTERPDVPGAEKDLAPSASHDVVRQS